MISPTVLAIIGVLYTGPDRAKAIGRYATVMGVAAASGQLLGGLLLHANIAGLGWRLVFLVNIPIGVAALAAARRFLPESRAASPARVDLLGLSLLTLGLAALVGPLVDGRVNGWPWWTLASLGAAPLILTAFVARQRAVARDGREPLLDLALFRQRTFTVGLLTQLVFWAGQASYFLVLALYLQLGRGLSALQSGLVFTILAGAYLAASMRGPALTERCGRTVIVAGALSLAAGHLVALFATAHIGAHGAILLLTPGLLLAGAGMGLCIGPLTTAVLADVDPRRAGAVSGTLSTAQQVGNALGVALIGLVFFGNVHAGYARAFEDSLGVLTVLLVGVAGCARLLPR